jgi:hypothetical protein
MNGNLEEMMLKTFRYALALPLATYLYNYNFKEVIDLNNIINDYFPEEFFLYLGLNFKKEEFILEDNEFKKINKIYHEYVKKLW